MDYPYGMRSLPAVGGGLPGLPRRVASLYNEVISSHTFNVNTALNVPASGVVFPIPFAIKNPSELDIVFRCGHLESNEMTVRIVPLPDGSGVVDGIFKSMFTFLSYDPVAHAVVFRALSGDVVEGCIQVIRRNRKVVNWGTFSGNPTVTPFTIKNPAKTWLGPLAASNQSYRFGAWLDTFLSSTGAGWHMLGNSSEPREKSRVTGPNTMQSFNGTMAPAYLIEFE